LVEVKDTAEVSAVVSTTTLTCLPSQVLPKRVSPGTVSLWI